jgi:hypothetical protein
MSRLYGATTLATTSTKERPQEQKKAGDEEERRGKKVLIVRALRELASLVTFVNIPGDYRLAFAEGRRVVMPSIVGESIVQSFQSSLRSLDLVHVAAAKYARQVNSELAAFVTADNELLSSKRREILEITGIPAISPKDYVKSTGLQ